MGESERDPVHRDVLAWVDDYFVRVFGDALGYRSGDQIHWCPEWWRHPSAVVRLDALWRAWEYSRAAGALGISNWLLDHADPHVRVLTAEHGPFRHCSIERGHRPTEPLPVTGPEGGDRLFVAPGGSEGQTQPDVPR